MQTCSVCAQIASLCSARLSIKIIWSLLYNRCSTRARLHNVHGIVIITYKTSLQLIWRLGVGIGWGWTHTGCLALILIHFDPRGLACTHLYSRGLAWTHLDSHGLTWPHLDSLGFTWTPSDALGLAWTHLETITGLAWTSRGLARTKHQDYQRNNRKWQQTSNDQANEPSNY